MICAGKGVRVIANIWNGSLDKRNICSMLREKPAEQQKNESEGKEAEKKGKGESGARCFPASERPDAGKIFPDSLTASRLNAQVS